MKGAEERLVRKAEREGRDVYDGIGEDALGSMGKVDVEMDAGVARRFEEDGEGDASVARRVDWMRWMARRTRPCRSWPGHPETISAVSSLATTFSQNSSSFCSSPPRVVPARQSRMAQTRAASV